MTKILSASGGLCPLDQGLCPWTPLGALPPDPRYRLVLRTRHGAPPTTDPFRRLCASRGPSAIAELLVGSEFQTAGSEHRKARFANVVVVKGL